MTGRKETDNKYRDKTKFILNNAPKELEEFYNSKASALKIRTLNTYIKTLSKFLRDVNKDIENIKRSDINAYFADMVERDCSASHRATTFSALKQFFEFLEGEQYISFNPMDENVKRAKIKKVTSIREDYLTKDEIIKFMRQINGEKDPFKRRRNKAMIMLFLHTGMRISALRELNLDDIDLTESTVRVVTKGEKEQTFRGINSAIDCIQEYLILRSYVAKDDVNALFVSESGDRIHENVIRYIVRKYANAITDKNITPHKLRASYCTMLYNDGVDLYALQQLMGHSSMATTEIYIRGQENKSADASARIDKILAM